jgi:UDP-N-acetylmuramyl tripeptide synthase
VTTKKPLRARLASSVSRSAAALSRAAGRGDGSVIGGKIGLMIDPNLLANLAEGRQIALVSGTNGKTTTTRLTTAALGVLGPVATNSFGANMPTGHTSALARAGDTPYAVLEVDEHYLPEVLAKTKPRVVALLNLSRDQLDRAKEVAMMAQLWRDTLAASPVHVVANADDPMVTWAARAADVPGAGVTWVAAGQRWHDDSWVCPECGAHIERTGAGPHTAVPGQVTAGTGEEHDPLADATVSLAAATVALPVATGATAGPAGTGVAPAGEGALAEDTVAFGVLGPEDERPDPAGPTVLLPTVPAMDVPPPPPGDGPARPDPSAPAPTPAAADGDWWCTGCSLRRPVPQWRVDDDAVVGPDGRRHPVRLALPGRVNRANAATALAVAAHFGVDPALAAPHLSEVASIAGRYAQVERDGRAIRLLLAKNPAGWLEAFDMAEDAPTLLSINSRDPDGLDTSWLFDVDFSPLHGRPVLITGERAFDLAVRLEVNDVAFTHVRSFGEAVAAVPPGRLEVIANYTAFQDIRAELDRVN